MLHESKSITVNDIKFAVHWHHPTGLSCCSPCRVLICCHANRSWVISPSVTLFLPLIRQSLVRLHHVWLHGTLYGLLFQLFSRHHHSNEMVDLKQDGIYIWYALPTVWIFGWYWQIQIFSLPMINADDNTGMGSCIDNMHKKQQILITNTNYFTK